MITRQWLAINKNGIQRIRKTKPHLNWDEIAILIRINIPDDLFKRPQIEAKLIVQEVPNTVYNPEIIINTKDLIEQQTGAKIDFTVVHEEKKKD